MAAVQRLWDARAAAGAWGPFAWVSRRRDTDTRSYSVSALSTKSARSRTPVLGRMETS
jgi:hypothetical protein